MVDRKGLARAIKIARSKAELTQREMASKSGVSYGAVINLERGVVDTRFETIVRLCKVLNVSEDEFIKYYE